MDRVRCTLFTNLDGMWIDGMLLHAHALLLEERWVDDLELDLHSHSCQMRGFGPDCRWPVFERAIPSIDYKIEHRAAEGMPPLADREGYTPTLKGGSIKLAGFPEPILYDLHDPELALDVRTFDGDHDIFTQVWKTLDLHTQTTYWAGAGMPRLTYGFSPRAEDRVRSRHLGTGTERTS